MFLWVGLYSKAMAYPLEKRQQAKKLFLSGLKPKEIATRLKIDCQRVIYNWAKSEAWEDLLAFDSPANAIARRISRIAELPGELTTAQQNELDKLCAIHLKLTTKDTPQKTDRQAKEQSKGERRPKKEKPLKNDISSLNADIFNQWFDSELYLYQKGLREVKNDPALNRERNILKSRQIGLTWYFALEAFEDAVLTGDNQLFLSASKNQAKVFKSYILAFAQQFGIELKGSDSITLSNGATLYFLGTNSATAQSYHGHLYLDEYFWIPKFKELKDLAGGMATDAKWRKTYFSTASTLTHPAYGFWSGEDFKKRTDKYAKNKHWPTDAQYTDGVLCPDGQWRQIITIHDAARLGCNRFNIERLRLENTPEVFAQLYECKFIDATASVFKLQLLEKCLAQRTAWHDYNPHAARPFGDKPVWIGYDPSRKGDFASVVVLAAPDEQGGKIRVLEKLQLISQSLTYQANQIKRLTEKYNVVHIGVDTTGMGLGVYEMITDFFPRAMAIHYSLEAKTALVLKGLDVMTNKRLVWDGSEIDIAAAFLTIKQTTTAGGHITYSSNRTSELGHADVAWAILHALFIEPLNINKTRRSRYSFIGGSHAKKAA